MYKLYAKNYRRHTNEEETNPVLKKLNTVGEEKYIWKWGRVTIKEVPKNIYHKSKYGKYMKSVKGRYNWLMESWKALSWGEFKIALEDS